MCTEILVEGGPFLQTLGEITDLVGAEKIVFRDGYPPVAHLGRSSCLCPVDTDATAVAAGYEPDWVRLVGNVWRKADIQ